MSKSKKLNRGEERKQYERRFEAMRKQAADERSDKRAAEAMAGVLLRALDDVLLSIERRADTLTHIETIDSGEVFNFLYGQRNHVHSLVGSYTDHFWPNPGLHEIPAAGVESTSTDDDENDDEPLTRENFTEHVASLDREIDPKEPHEFGGPEAKSAKCEHCGMTRRAKVHALL